MMFLESWALIAVCGVPVLYLLRRWNNGSECQSNSRLDGKIVVVTGANTGIGKGTAIDMATRGAVVIMACRDRDRGRGALKEVKDRSKNNNVHLRILDLSSLDSVRNFAKSFLLQFKELNILINNAAVGACPYAKTVDGFEMQFGVNHLGHFALTNLLLPLMVESTSSRVVNVSSKLSQLPWVSIKFDDINSEKEYSPFGAYCQSKLANVLFTKELSNRLSNTNVTTYALHPGTIRTEIGRHMNFVVQYIMAVLAPLFFKSPYQGAQTTIYCAIQEGIENHSGYYFDECAVQNTTKICKDDGLAKKLWEISEDMTAVKFPL